MIRVEDEGFVRSFYSEKKLVARFYVTRHIVDRYVMYAKDGCIFTEDGLRFANHFRAHAGRS